MAKSCALERLLSAGFRADKTQRSCSLSEKSGFEGPFSGGKHQFMIKDDVTLRAPNPHRGDISRDLLSRILKQAGINKEDWEKL